MRVGESSRAAALRSQCPKEHRGEPLHDIRPERVLKGAVFKLGRADLRTTSGLGRLIFSSRD